MYGSLYVNIHAIFFLYIPYVESVNWGVVSSGAFAHSTSSLAVIQVKNTHVDEERSVIPSPLKWHKKTQINEKHT